MRSGSYKKIRFKLIIIFVIAVTAVVGIVLGLNKRLEQFIQQNSQIGSLINISGSQRMFGEQIAKTALFLVDHHSGTEEEQLLDSLLTFFELRHAFLKSENEQLHIDPSTREHLDSLFDGIDPYVGAVLTAGRALLRPEPENEISRDSTLAILMAGERSFLPRMNAITISYDQLSSQVLGIIGRNMTFFNEIIALAVIISASSVFFVTTGVIRRYSRNLEDTQHQLRKSVDEVNGKVEKLEFLTSAIKVGIWEKSKEEGTEKWSEQLYHILGLDYLEVPGTLESFIERVHPSDRQLVKEVSDRVFSTGEPMTIEVRVLTKSGSYKWVEATGSVKRGADGVVKLIIGGVIDIHERKVLENQLREFVDNAPAAIAMFNTKVEYLAASRAWLSTFYLSQGVYMGASLYEALPRAKGWEEVHQRCLAGAVEKQDEFRMVRSDGTEVWMKWEIRPWYLSEDEIGGILMMTEDITESKRKNDELRAAKDQAEKASKAKEEFLATMTHEIRTPLNAIIGMTHILSSESPKPDQVDNLNLLKFSADNLLTLINDILDISKIESGKLVLEQKPFDLFYLVENIRRSLSFRAKENLVTISTSYDPDLPRIFVGDVTRITQILYNLAGNAIKFSNGGHVGISVKMLDEEGDSYLFRMAVKDNGIGISQEKQEKIFLSFEQADSGTTRQYGGTGLGLYITKKLLQLMDSDIQLESEIGKGSDFFFDLKLPKGTLDIHTVPGIKSGTPDFSGQDVKVLIAEDNITNRIIMEKFLSKTTVRFDFANDGEEVLEKLKHRDYDMILMDLQMPVMDGYTATIRIRSNEDPYYRQIPIIALTADAFLDVRDKTLSMGMDDYLSKPFRPKDLFEVLSRHLGKVDKPV